jgi:hypothetical protein
MSWVHRGDLMDGYEPGELDDDYIEVIPKPTENAPDATALREAIEQAYALLMDILHTLERVVPHNTLPSHISALNTRQIIDSWYAQTLALLRSEPRGEEPR